VTLPDVNLLLYAYNQEAPEHEPVAAWLRSLFENSGSVLFSWATLLGFFRISTNRQVFTVPLEVQDAVAAISHWLVQPNVQVIQPGERYWDILQELIIKAQVRGAMISDAHLAALAIEHGATLFTTDRDFTRFPGLRVQNPLEL
jgi:toxin-antitoxin system PIN domain toxin